jgi:hypothetical protein
LFLSIPVVVAIRSMRAFWRARLTTQWIPLAVGVSAILGIMGAMYTVWFGFAYSVLWMVMIGVTMSMCDVLIYGPPASRTAPASRQYAPPRRGFAVATGA